MGRDMKVMVVGDGGVGKTCMLISYTTNSFPGEYVPTVFDNYTAPLVVEGQPVEMGLWDTAGSDEYSDMRVMSYPDTNVFLICFDLTSRESYNNVKTKWRPEIDAFSKDIPVLIVGTKLDMRANAPGAISEEEGKKLAQETNAVGYIECSALTQQNLPEVFESAIKAVFYWELKKDGKVDAETEAKREKCSVM